MVSWSPPDEAPPDQQASKLAAAKASATPEPKRQRDKKGAAHCSVSLLCVTVLLTTHMSMLLTSHYSLLTTHPLTACLTVPLTACLCPCSVSLPGSLLCVLCLSLLTCLCFSLLTTHYSLLTTHPLTACLTVPLTACLVHADSKDATPAAKKARKSGPVVKFADAPNDKEDSGVSLSHSHCASLFLLCSDRSLCRYSHVSL